MSSDEEWPALEAHLARVRLGKKIGIALPIDS